MVEPTEFRLQIFLQTNKFGAEQFFNGAELLRFCLRNIYLSWLDRQASLYMKTTKRMTIPDQHFDEYLKQLVEAA